MELDKGLAEADPLDFTPAMRHGVACALNADPRRTYWGRKCDDGWDQPERWWYGCLQENRLSEQTKSLIASLDAVEDGEDMTAREIMTAVTAKDEDANYSMPSITQKVQGTAPKKINAYSDGSLKNTTGLF